MVIESYDNRGIYWIMNVIHELDYTDKKVTRINLFCRKKTTIW